MRILIIMCVSFYVYVYIGLALLYNTYYKVITVGEISLCADTAIGLALEKTPWESDWPIEPIMYPILSHPLPCYSIP